MPWKKGSISKVLRRMLLMKLLPLVLTCFPFAVNGSGFLKQSLQASYFACEIPLPKSNKSFLLLPIFTMSVNNIKQNASLCILHFYYNFILFDSFLVDFHEQTEIC